VLGGLAGGRGDGPDAVLEGGDPLLEHGRGGVHDPRVDVPEALEREQVGGVLGVLEDVRAGLVDGHRASARDGVRPLAGVDREGVESELLLALHRASVDLRAKRLGNRTSRRDSLEFPG